MSDWSRLSVLYSGAQQFHAGAAGLSSSMRWPRGSAVPRGGRGTQQLHVAAAGLSSSILGCLLTLLIYSYCQRYQHQSHDATVTHPVFPATLNSSITNHISKLDKYNSVKTLTGSNQQ